MLFQDKIVLVTGGASGLGRSACRDFANEGATVVIADLSAGAAEALAQAIDAEGGRAVAYAVDVASSSSVDALFAMIGERFGRLDVAVNSAGIGGTPGPLAEMSEETFDLVQSVNLKGVWLCMRRELPLIERSGGGAIVNIASALGLIALPDAAAYCASKHGVVGLTKVAALEYAERGVRINAICPGVIDTPLNTQVLSDPASVAGLKAVHPMNRLGRSEEVAPAILWLASPQASFITGTAMSVDGGWTTR